LSGVAGGARKNKSLSVSLSLSLSLAPKTTNSEKKTRPYMPVRPSLLVAMAWTRQTVTHDFFFKEAKVRSGEGGGEGGV